MLFSSLTPLVFLLGATSLVASAPTEPIEERSTQCASGKPFTGQAGCSKCTVVGNVVCGRDEDKITDLKCTKFSTGLTWVPINNPKTCGVDYPAIKEREAEAEPTTAETCKSGKPFTGQAGCSKCTVVGNVVCGRDEDKVTDLKCTKFSTGLTWVPINNPGKCGVDSPPPPPPSTCKSGKPFTGQAGCSKCTVVGNVVCGRDEDKITDLKCTKFSTGLTWVPINNPGTCGADHPAIKEREAEAEPAAAKTCKSGKPFTGQAGCSRCTIRGNVVCGRDEDRVTDLKCTKFSTGLTWVPINNPGTCGVDHPAIKEREAEAEPAAAKTCKSGKPFTGQAGCSRCTIRGNVVCGRDEDRVTDLKCTKFSTGLTWVPIDNPRACGV